MCWQNQVSSVITVDMCCAESKYNCIGLASGASGQILIFGVILSNIDPQQPEYLIPDNKSMHAQTHGRSPSLFAIDDYLK